MLKGSKNNNDSCHINSADIDLKLISKDAKSIIVVFISGAQISVDPQARDSKLGDKAPRFLA